MLSENGIGITSYGEFVTNKLLNGIRVPRLFLEQAKQFAVHDKRTKRYDLLFQWNSIQTIFLVYELSSKTLDNECILCNVIWGFYA